MAGPPRLRAGIPLRVNGRRAVWRATRPRTSGADARGAAVQRALGGRAPRATRQTRRSARRCLTQRSHPWRAGRGGVRAARGWLEPGDAPPPRKPSPMVALREGKAMHASASSQLGSSRCRRGRWDVVRAAHATGSHGSLVFYFLVATVQPVTALETAWVPWVADFTPRDATPGALLPSAPILTFR